MALPTDSLATRTMARIRRFLGVMSASEIADGGKSPEEKNIHFGMYTTDELRHVDGVLQNFQKDGGNRKFSEQNIENYLTQVATNTRRKIDEIKNLKLLAPEIEQAKQIIVSSIISPQDLQTDSVSISVNHPGLGEEINGKISSYLTDFFNDEYGLGPRLVEWLGCAGFEEGSKPIIVLPRSEIDVMNTIADKWNPGQKEEFDKLKREMDAKLAASTESFHQLIDEDQAKASIESLACLAEAQLEARHIGKDFIDVTEISDQKKKKAIEGLNTAEQLSKVLAEKSYQILRTTEKGDAVVITKDIRALSKVPCMTSQRMSELEKEAEKQVRGYDSSMITGGKAVYPVLNISDVITTSENDLPIVIELPADAVIPVCAPRDPKNHIGYYVLIDENGQPCRGQYAFNLGGVSSDINNRLATNAAKSAFGDQAVQTYLQSGLTQADMLNQMTQVFTVAVNHLLETKLNKEGLTGLDINVHEAVGKCLFFNLLAKNKIRMVFVPGPMLIYYRFLHREDGTGKTFLEDIAFILALRCTLTIAKIMAAVDNATKHRKIEVNVDEKNVNPLQTLEMVRHEFLAKKAPQFTTDPTTTAENILNSHLSIVPKGLVGNTDDLNITTETSYGQSQAPDSGIMEDLNNWLCMGLHMPPSALNQLSETEYAKSVATSNLFFSNQVRNWQNIIKPINSKFIINYILANEQLLDGIRKIISDDRTGTATKTKNGIQMAEPDDPKEHQNQEPEKNEKVELALKRVVATAELVLAPPNMSTSKAHFEEITAQVEAVGKILDTVYPDDVAPNDDLRSLMSSIRAMVASKVLREFLPKLGFHEIADIPSIEDVNDDDSAKIILRLNEIKRRMDALGKLGAAQLLDQPKAGESTDFGSTSTGGSDEGGEGGEDNGMGDFGLPDMGDEGGDNAFKI